MAMIRAGWNDAAIQNGVETRNNRLQELNHNYKNLMEVEDNYEKERERFANVFPLHPRVPRRKVKTDV